MSESVTAGIHAGNAKFAFKAMGSVLPIAGFFFVGAPDTAGATWSPRTWA